MSRDREPVYVHCADCNHEWVMFYAPITCTDLAKFITPCPMCLGKNIFTGRKRTSRDRKRDKN